MNISEKLGPACWFFEKYAEIQSLLKLHRVISAQANIAQSFVGFNFVFAGLSLPP